MKVAILRGGAGAGYDSSLESGRTVLDNLHPKYHATDIFIDKDGGWNAEGVAVLPEKVLQESDVVFNALHSDTEVTQLFNQHKTSFTGSGTLTSALARNRFLTKEKLRQAEILVPHGILIEADVNPTEVVSEIFQLLSPPWVIKPTAVSFSDKPMTVNTPDELEFLLNLALENFGQLLVERLIGGKEFTVGVIENFREKDYYVTPVINLPTEVSAEDVENVAVDVFRTLGMNHYGQINFEICPRGKIYVLETHCHPALHEGGDFVKALESTGIKTTPFLDHVISLARNR